MAARGRISSVVMLDSVIYNFYFSKKNGSKSPRRCAGARKRARANIFAQAGAARRLSLSSIDLDAAARLMPFRAVIDVRFADRASRCSGAANDIAAQISLWPIMARGDAKDAANNVAKGFVVVHAA